MRRLALAISAERRQASVSGAIGMAHQIYARTLVQQDRHAYLLEDEIALEVIARRGQRLRAAGDDDHVRPQNGLVLQEFLHGVPDALVKTAEESGIRDVRGGR